MIIWTIHAVFPLSKILERLLTGPYKELTIISFPTLVQSSRDQSELLVFFICGIDGIKIAWFNCKVLHFDISRLFNRTRSESKTPQRIDKRHSFIFGLLTALSAHPFVASAFHILMNARILE